MSQWFVADSRQQLPALSLALMALLLALAASVGVGSMTEGFRKTFVGWLDLRLSADLYVSPRDTARGLQIAEWLGQQPPVGVVLPGWRVETQLQGWPVQVQWHRRSSRLSHTLAIAGAARAGLAATGQWAGRDAQ